MEDEGDVENGGREGLNDHKPSPRKVEVENLARAQLAKGKAPKDQGAVRQTFMHAMLKTRHVCRAIFQAPSQM